MLTVTLTIIIMTLWVNKKFHSRFCVHIFAIREMYLDYRSWNGTIPAITFCYNNRFDDLRAQYLIERLWNIGKKDVEYAYFLDFIKLVSNTSISSFKLFNRYANDKRFEYLDMSIVAKDVHPNVNAIISAFVPTINPRYVQVMTERGICYSVNSQLQSQLMGTKYDISKNRNYRDLKTFFHVIACKNWNQLH